MELFAQLINALDSTNKVNAKKTAVHEFLNQATEEDKLWLLALFTGKKPKRPVNSTLLKAWAMKETNMPEWLFIEAYSAVGDLGETIALILPPSENVTRKPLAQWMAAITTLKDKSDAEKETFVTEAWKQLNTQERFIFNKLIGGSFRVGLSSKGMINALAQYYQQEEAAVAHSIMGDWRMAEVNFESLIKGEYANTDQSKPYPFCLAYSLEREQETLTELNLWQAEYKWDGIRCQIIKRGDEVFLWSRGEELINTQFPEVVDTIVQWPGSFVLDGELLAVKVQTVLDFSALQKRLNRKTITKKMMEETPVGIYFYDLIEWNHEDWRAKPLEERRSQLEHLLTPLINPPYAISTKILANDFEALAAYRANARLINSEGLMLKKLDSPYHSGRKKGDWWKWKVDPLTIDAVLIYAQKGSGRRSGYYTDYTFAIRNGEALVTITKAYSGLTDKEIQEVSKFVNKNALEKFGPVRTVKPELVFEIAFEGISYSSRHKAGVALRFPRILRWRKDKTVKDIDDITSVKQLIK